MSSEPDMSHRHHNDAHEFPSPRYAGYVVTLLTLAYIVSFLDRQVLNLLVEPIKADLHISDTEISLLMGLAFGIFYTLMGIPIGRLVDRYSRRSIIAIGITLWCVMTAGCGLAKNFGQLFIARIGVGIGEASLTPSALSLISDYFPKEKRGRAISFYNMGISLGAGTAMILGGMVINFVQTAPPLVLPIVGQLFAWQSVFIVVGLPGIVIALLMVTVKEPVRRELLAIDGATDPTGSQVLSLRFVARYLFSRWKTYLTLFLGMSIVTIIGYAYFSWIPTMFIRVYGWSIKDVGLAYGIILLIFGPIGVNLGGWLADRLYKRGAKDGHMRATFIGALVTVPSATLAPLMPSPELAVLMLIPASIGPAMTTATGAASLMMITPNQMRGQFSAIYLFVINILGLTIGPTAVALVTDFVFRDESALNKSIALVSLIAGVIALVFLSINRVHYLASVRESESWTT